MLAKRPCGYFIVPKLLARYLGAMKKDLARNRLSLTHSIPRHLNPYIDLMLGEYAPYTRTEEQALGLKGRWRQEVFAVSESTPLDLEIGTGNGFHFSHHCLTSPDRVVVGLEIKFKPLVQSIRRVVREGGKNGCMVRFHGGGADQMFLPSEVDNIYIHFPDPWPKKRHFKNRLIQDDFLGKMHGLQKPGSFLEFKTDSESYFEWAAEKMENSPYEVEFLTEDLHNSERASSNFVTQFESLFLRKGLPIHYALLRKKT